MTSKRIAQSDRQQKSEKPQESGILQRAAVRSDSDAGMQSTEDQEALALSNSAFSKDFSQVPISTTKPQQFHARNLQSHPMPPIQAKLTIGEPGDRVIQGKGEMTENSEVSSEVQRPNKTGLPDRLKTGIENLSGIYMEDMKVHYNSDKPAQLNALAYVQGSDIHVAPGQERYLPHEAWHVVQQAQGRVKPTMQMKRGVAVNDDHGLEREADVMGARAAQMKANSGKSPVVQRAITNGGSVVQRVVGQYKPKTLAYTTLAMKDLTLAQMNIVQQLHDNSKQNYTVDQARQIATGGISTSFNPYEWDVKGIGSYATTDTSVQSILNHFGHPTHSVVKTYDDLANRVGFDAGKDGKGVLSVSTISDLHKHFEASKPLHIGFNPFLHSAWTNNLDAYNGAKTGIPLYSVMRSEITKDFKAEPLGTVTLNDVLKEVSGRPSEVHHLLFKAHYPKIATTPFNLMLTERSESEKKDGPGQHELMHKVASGNDADKFKVLLSQYVNEYNEWLKNNTGKKLV